MRVTEGTTVAFLRSASSAFFLPFLFCKIKRFPQSGRKEVEMAANISQKLLGSFMGYRGTLELKSGKEYTGGTIVANSGSMYSNGANGTGVTANASISISTLKALLMYKGIDEIPDSQGCVSYDPQLKRSVAEIKNNYKGQETVDVAVYLEAGGTFMAGTVDTSTGSIEPIEIGNRYGTVCMLAMLPVISKDPEAATLIGKSSITEETIAALSDNIYFRLKSGALKCVINSSGVVMQITQASIDNGVYAPTTAVWGTKDFEILATVNSKTGTKRTPPVDKNRFLTEFVLNTERELKKREKKLVPSLPDWYLIPSEAVISCKMITSSTKKNRPVRNVLLKGPAGTGKTETAKAIAAGLHIPYTHETCDAGMELFNLIGTILPATDGEVTMTAEELAAKFDLPTVEEVQFDYEDAYRRIKGMSQSEELPQGLTEAETIAALFDRQMEIIGQIAGRGQNGKDFVYVPSELIKAVKYGWVCEVQEPTVIIQPGVLPGLNSMLEGGSISLPTGEVVERHPDSVIVFTTNTDYEGCRALNESVLDRFPLKFLIDLPDEATLIERAKTVTGVSDDNLIKKCLNVLDETREYLLSSGEGIGNVGPRTLYDWLDAADIMGSAIEAAEYTLLTSASDDEEIKDFIRTSILAPAF